MLAVMSNSSEAAINLTRLYTISVDIETVALAAPTVSITAFDVVETAMVVTAETFRVTCADAVALTDILAVALPSSMLMFFP